MDRPRDAVNRDFTVARPKLCAPGLTDVTILRGLVYLAFVIDAFARPIVLWRVSNSWHTDIALDALEQALYDSRIGQPAMMHHSDS